MPLRFEGSAQERLEKLKTFILSSDIVAFFLSSEEVSGLIDGHAKTYFHTWCVGGR